MERAEPVKAYPASAVDARQPRRLVGVVAGDEGGQFGVLDYAPSDRWAALLGLWELRDPKGERLVDERALLLLERRRGRWARSNSDRKYP